VEGNISVSRVNNLLIMLNIMAGFDPATLVQFCLLRSSKPRTSQALAPRYSVDSKSPPLLKAKGGVVLRTRNVRAP
jgi:hypothetical protein